MFLNFMLARLISARQVVLLCNSRVIRLFYQGQVYCRPSESGFYDLPTHSKTPYCPIWALIDMDFEDKEPPIESDSDVWPIQASSPNSVRWKFWAKQFDPALWGMPLWDMRELNEGCVFGLSPLSAIDPGHVVR
jgi:hypothetical protein